MMPTSGSAISGRIVTVVPMATAIARGYCSDGFVIAADGRTSEVGVDNRRVFDNTQKIIPIGDSVTYVAMGVVELGDLRETRLDTILFDFTREFSEQFQPEILRRCSTLLDFARYAAMEIQENFIAACRNPNLDFHTEALRDGGGKEIVNVLLDGYVNGRPERVRVLFWHANGTPGPPDVIAEPSNVGLERYGSRAVMEKLASDRNFYLKHSIENQGVGSSYKGDLPNLIHQAAVFLEASKSAEAQKIDPIVSPGIGGHTHIAVIPKGEALQWVIAPLPLSRR